MANPFMLEIEVVSEAQFEDLTAWAFQSLGDEFQGSSQSMKVSGLDSVAPVLPEFSGLHRAQFFFSNQNALNRFVKWIEERSLLTGSIAMKEISEKDWMSEWRKHFKGVEVGGRFFVAPIGQALPSPDWLPIWIEPGMGFGTGTHETTQLCLEALASLSLTHSSVLDFGAGSGILSIGAKRLGAQQILAVEIDEDAIQNAFRNFELNGFNSQISIERFLPMDHSNFDVIVANILERVLLEHCEALVERTDSNGQMILSGLLHHQVDKVLVSYLEALEKRFRRPFQSEIKKRGEWAMIRIGAKD